MTTPRNPLEIAVVLTLSGRMHAEELRRLAEERILPHERFCQTVAEAPFPMRPRWQAETKFELDEHVLIHSEPALSDAALAEQVATRLSQPLGFERAPWRMELFVLEGGHSALLFRVHHCVADGLALVRLLCEMADPPQPKPPRNSPAAPERVRHSAPVILRAVGRARALWSTLTGLVTAPRDDTRELHGPSGHKSVAWSAPIDLPSLTAVAEGRGRHVTELLLGAAAEALGRSLHAAGRDVPRSVRALVPFGSTLGRRELGNHFASAFVELLLKESDPWRRVEDMAEHTKKLQDASHAGATRTLIGLAGWLSPALMRRALDFFSRRASLLVSNVPGPSEPVRLFGNTVRSIVVFAPPASSLGLSFTLFGYAGELRLGVQVDRALPLSPRQLVSDFQAALEALTDSAEWARAV